MIGQIKRLILAKSRGFRARTAPRSNPRWEIEIVKEPPSKIFFVKLGRYLARYDHLTIYLFSSRNSSWSVGRIPWFRVRKITVIYNVVAPQLVLGLGVVSH